jgi:hypothetical protein
VEISYLTQFMRCSEPEPLLERIWFECMSRPKIFKLVENKNIVNVPSRDGADMNGTTP